MFKHITLGIECARGLLERKQMRGQRQRMFINKGKWISFKECFQILNSLKESGYKVIPTCLNHDKKGYCTGHQVSTH